MRRFSRTVTRLSEGTSRILVQIGIKWGHYNVFPCKCFRIVRKWLRNYFYFSKATLCIRGLVFSHSFVNHAIVGILITYLTNIWSTEQSEMAALVTNLQEGITAVMVIVLAHKSDTHKSRFKMIVSTNAAYFLVLLAMRRFSRTVTRLSEGTSRILVQIGIKWGHYNVFPCKCFRIVRKWLRNYFYFSKATLCIRGLVFSHSFVNHAIVGILITYLTDIWSTEQSEMASLVTNLQEGITAVMVIVLAHKSDTHKNRFKMIVSTNAAYFLGLLLLWICSKFMSAHTSVKVYYGAAVLLVAGEAGRSATLPEFLDDQYFSEQKQTQSSDESYLIRLESRREALWSHPWFLGAFVPIFLTTMSWTRTFFISATLVGATYLVFLLGYSCYFVRGRIDESTLQYRFDYMEKLAVLYPVEQQRGGEICMVTRFDTSSPLGGQEEQRKRFWPLIKRRGEKLFFIELIAMWSTFLAYSLVEATGSTFFFEQMSNLDYKIGSLTARPLYFKILSSVSCFLVSFLYELLVPKQWRKATLVRIGLGLVCSMLCCVAAWQVERERLKLVSNEGLEHDTSQVTSMSILWLVPQFFLLGLMKGLAMYGLIDFLANLIANNDRLRARYYGSHITDFAIGVGKIFAAVSILALRGIWFDHSINRSHLDKLYKLLTFLCLINVVYYVCISFYFYGNKQNSADRENEENTELEEGVEGCNADDENGNNEVSDPVGGADNTDEYIFNWRDFNLFSWCM